MSGGKARLSVSVGSPAVLAELKAELFDLLFVGNPFCPSGRDGAFAAGSAPACKTVLATQVCPTDDEAAEIHRTLSRAGESIRGVEVHTFGMARFLRREFPNLEIYFGSFCNAYNLPSALLLQEMGLKGGVLPCELSIDEIHYISERSSLEILLPVHGPFPIAYSRYCFFFPEGPPHPCDAPCAEESVLSFGEGLEVTTRGRALFSARCLTMAHHLGDLQARGFSHFRIEGLYQPPEALNCAGELYRRRLEGSVSPEEMDAALAPFAPRGFCNGFYFSLRGMDCYRPGAPSC